MNVITLVIYLYKSNAEHLYKSTLECPQLSNKYILELSNKLSTIVKNVCFPIHSRSESFITKKMHTQNIDSQMDKVSYSVDAQCIVILNIILA